MSGPLSRRAFLGIGAAAAATVGVGIPRPSFSRGPVAPPDFPRQDLALVHDVVLYSHFDLDAVRELVTERPALAKAGWDWGFGDWETPLGAASHTGRREIAEFLMSHGARPGFLTFAMLGQLEVVRAVIEARPEARRITGPHGLTLLHHARAGGEEAVEVADYLEELGGADPRPRDLPLSAEQLRVYVGSYVLRDGPREAFDIIERKGHIAFRHGDDAPRNLMNQGNHEFHPVGAPAVRIRFDVTEGRARGLEILDGTAIYGATRQR